MENLKTPMEKCDIPSIQWFSQTTGDAEDRKSQCF